MKYDVFISYSREDSLVVSKICVALKSAGISYFCDESQEHRFTTDVSEAILNSTLLLFVASESSYKSKGARQELYFALDEVRAGHILTYVVDSASVPRDVELLLNATKRYDMDSCPISEGLISSICLHLGRADSFSGTVAYGDSGDSKASSKRSNLGLLPPPEWMKIVLISLGAIAIVVFIVCLCLSFVDDDSRENVGADVEEVVRVQPAEKVVGKEEFDGEDFGVEETEEAGDEWLSNGDFSGSETREHPDNGYLIEPSISEVDDGDALYHTIESGDTFSVLAQRYNTTTKRLHELNPEVNPAALLLGQKILVRGKGPSDGGLNVASRGEGSDGGYVMSLYHTIRAGDTFSSLAQQYNTTTERLRELNPEVNPAKQKVGTRIRVK